MEHNVEKEVKKDLLEILNSKSCKGCTKCCEGYLSANIRGYEMDKGKPCPFVTKDVGCNEYDKRPENPCVTFECEWRRNPYFDEWLSPVNAQAVFTRQSIQGIPYLRLTEAGAPLNSKVLTWAIQYAQSNNLNFAWELGDTLTGIGSPEFMSVITV